MRKLLFITFLFLSNLSMAGTFVVTSPLDDGSTGTLRWAITQAISNGTSGTDFIYFNIPSASPLFRVIQLNSDLPVLTDNVIIDGTTQPLGAPYGPTDAKIIITTKNFFTCKRGLVLRDVSNIEIYGLYFAGFISKTPQTPEIWSDGIFMCNVKNITIGAPGRGNAFTLNFHSIRNDALNENGGPLAGVSSQNIIIQNNFIGKNYTPANPPPPIDGTINGVELMGVQEVTVGGYSLTEKNEFMTLLSGLRISLTGSTTPAFVKVINNNFQPGTYASPPPVTLFTTGVEIINNISSQGNHFVTISHNSIFSYGAPVVLAGLKHPFSIENNSLNVNASFWAPAPTIGISVTSCDSGRIGEQDSSNLIRSAVSAGVALTGTKYICINQNSIYCNDKGISIIAPGITIPAITELISSPAAGLSGKTCSRCIVEIYTTDQCVSQVYNGKALDAIVTADAVGNWNYSGRVDCNTSYTVTDPGRATSEFYIAANFIFDSSGLVIRHATCGQSNGSIKGIKIFAGVDFHWEDNLGNIINTTDTNLLNLAPGFYKLVCTKQNLGCRLSSGLFEIKGITPVIDASAVQLNHPSNDCRVKGSITGIHVINTGTSPATFAYKWVNQLGVQVGTALNLLDVLPGSYTLTAYVSFDPSCFVTAGPFVLVDKPAPTFNLANLVITRSTCGLPNGAIRGVGINNAYAAQQFRWYDEFGTFISNTADLSNVQAGKYYLQYDDNSPCPPMTTALLEVGNDGLITIDASNKIIEASGCTVIKGAIKNIIVTGANQYQWINMADGSVAGTSADLLNIVSGNYKLRVYDTNYGCSDSSEIFFVPTTAIQPLNVQSKLVKDETCTHSNGSISNIVFQPAAAGYNFKWIKLPNDTFSNSLNVLNLASADYVLIAYDSNGCIQTVMQQTISDHPSPVLDETAVAVANDTCTLRSGAIKNMGLLGGEPAFNYLWYNAGNNSIAGTGKDLKNVGAGNYYQVVADKNGCRDTSTVFNVADVNLVLLPPKYDPVYAKRNQPAYIKNQENLPGTYELYDSPSGNLPLQTNTTGTFRTAALTADKDFWIERSTGSCRSARIKVHVTVIDFSKVFVPNAFTPNNDGLNDQLTIKVYGDIAIDYFIIFDRWGKQLFITNKINKGWDGTSNGIIQPAGTYAWVIQGYDIDGSPIHLKGTVTIIK